jgi:hypothetical protein
MIVCGAWILCALLLFFADNARIAPYRGLQHSLKTASGQPYLAGTDWRLGVSLATLLLLWGVVTKGAPRAHFAHAASAIRARAVRAQRSEFDPESHLRAPPLK